MSMHHKDELQLEQPLGCSIDQARKERGGRSKFRGEIAPMRTVLVATKMLGSWLKTKLIGAGNKAVPKQHCAQVLHLWFTLLATSALDTWWSEGLVWPWWWSSTWWCEWSAVLLLTVETIPVPWQKIWVDAAIPCNGIARESRHITKTLRVFTSYSLTRFLIS